jgi:murein DD-endopeptidase MepM/ murein hydrolase activator NlpD
MASACSFVAFEPPPQQQAPASAASGTADAPGVAPRPSFLPQAAVPRPERAGDESTVALAPPSPLPAPSPPARITVATGDTIQSIARRHGVTVSQIIAANRLTPPYGLAEGSELRLPPGVRPVAAPAGVAAVAPGDGGETLASLPDGRGDGTDPGDAADPVEAAAAGGAPMPVPEPPSQEQPGEDEVVLAGRGFLWPVEGQVISRFGPKANGLRNDGINIAAPAGAPVRAAENGVVAYAGNELKGFGNMVLLKHVDGWMTAYAHADSILVKKGQRVRKGQIIAKVGSSGGVAKSQLHFEMRRNKKAVDPLRHLRRVSA